MLEKALKVGELFSEDVRIDYDLIELKINT
jgi:hypothetical protein